MRGFNRLQTWAGASTNGNYKTKEKQWSDSHQSLLTLYYGPVKVNTVPK